MIEKIFGKNKKIEDIAKSIYFNEKSCIYRDILQIVKENINQIENLVGAVSRYAADLAINWDLLEGSTPMYLAEQLVDFAWKNNVPIKHVATVFGIDSEDIIEKNTYLTGQNLYFRVTEKVYKTNLDKIKKEEINKDNYKDKKKRIDRFYRHNYFCGAANRSEIIREQIMPELEQLANKIYEFEVNCVKEEVKRNPELLEEVIRKYVRRPREGIIVHPAM